MNVGKCSFSQCCIQFSISLISCSPYFCFIHTHNVLHTRLAVSINKNYFKAQRLGLYQGEAQLSQKCGKKRQKDKLFINVHTPFFDDFSLFFCLWIKLFAAGNSEKFFFCFFSKNKQEDRRKERKTQRQTDTTRGTRGKMGI